MALMIVQREGNFRRPKSGLSFNFKPSPDAQSWPHDVVDYAVAKGLATRVETARQKAARKKPGN